MAAGYLKKSNDIKQRDGFTLIELLVVIATIALLLAILLPALRMAKAVSKRMACQSNLKQLACAWSMYLDHYDGYFYRGLNADIKFGGWKGILNLSPRPLNRFVGLAETLENENLVGVFGCPADTGGVPWYLPREEAYRYQGTSYRANPILIGQGNVPQNKRTEELAEKIGERIKQLNIIQVTASPAQLVLMGDQGWLHEWRPMSPVLKAKWVQRYKSCAEWHVKPECYNLAFLDGHVAFVKIRKAYFVTDDYTVIPFKDLCGLAIQVQGEDP